MRFTKFRPRVRSKNFTCNELRHYNSSLGFYPFRSLIRFGSLTPTNYVFPRRNNIVEINTVDSIERSRSKLAMKQCFEEAGVPQSKWYRLVSPYGDGVYVVNNTGLETSFGEKDFPILAKRIYGFKGKGMIKLNSLEEYNDWYHNNSSAGYYFEQFHNYAREYRLHVTKDGCFYSLRKMLKEETPEDKRWFRNDSNCVWILEDNPLFDKPINWEQIESDCIKALNVVGLDIGCFDVKVQSAIDQYGKARQNPSYILIEVNSAPSMGEITIEKYKQIIPKLLNDKYEDLLQRNL